MQQIYQQLSVLKLNGIRDALIQQAEQPNHYNELSFSERLALLLDQELNQKRKPKNNTTDTTSQIQGESAIGAG